MEVSSALPILPIVTIDAIAGIIHKGLGVSTYPMMLLDPVTRENIPDTVLGRPYSYLRTVSDFDIMFPEVKLSNLHHVANKIGNYFSSRLGALVRLFVYDEETLAAAQANPEWHDIWKNKAPLLESPYTHNYNFEDAERVGILTHKKITQEIISLMSQMIDLCKRVHCNGYEDDLSPVCQTSLDALAQNAIFKPFWESQRVEKIGRSVFHNLNLRDHEKVCLCIEGLRYHDHVTHVENYDPNAPQPTQRYIVYGERPGLIDIPDEIVQIGSLIAGGLKKTFESISVADAVTENNVEPPLALEHNPADPLDLVVVPLNTGVPVQRVPSQS